MSVYTVKQMAKLSGVSVRALHHYDTIGLLRPRAVGANGYRYYDRQDLLRLQQILFHRALETPLKDIRAALDEWRAKGKPTYAYAVSLGDGGSGMDMYWLATAFDKIWVQPTGFVTVNGFRAQAPYLRDLLDKHGIQPEFFSFTTYKTVMDIAMQIGRAHV